MKTIGLLGGMSWESSAQYYRVMNETVKNRLGGLHSAKILMHSVDFQPLRELMLQDDWDGIGSRLASAARNLEAAGADCIVIGTNTMHNAAPKVAAGVDVPLLHIADAAADAVDALGGGPVGLLGTIFTMEKPFYVDRLAERGIEALVPEAMDRRLVDRVIFDELCVGRFCEPSRTEYVRVIDDLAARGAKAVILGCTEIGLLVGPDDAKVPLLDTCALHAAAAVDWALDET